MSNQNTLLPALAATSGGGLTITTGPQRITTRMAENLLGMACSQERALAAQRRYRIGDYEFREADYAQIQRWARMLGIEPTAVVEELASKKINKIFDDEHTEFCVKAGTIFSLGWDFDRLPVTDWAWEKGLQIARLSVLNASVLNAESLPKLPECLHEFVCKGCQVSSVKLTQVPNLIKLDCSCNRLNGLDLTPVPKLQKLYCWGTRLTKLDLTPVPWLKDLHCYMNQLTELDLTPVPRLQNLWCDASLNITGAPPNLKIRRL